MTATTGAQPGVRPATQVRLAEQVRVAVIFAGQQHDVTLPANSPVAAVVEALIQVLQERRESTGAAAAVISGLVSLARINGERLDRGQTLAQQGVVDGDLLVMEVTDAEVAFTPIVESASSAVAMANAARFSAVTEHTAMAFAAVAAGVAALVALAVIGEVWQRNLASGQNWNVLPSVLAAGLAVVLPAAGWLTWRLHGEPMVACALWLSALVAAPAAAVMGTPGRAGSAHLLWAMVTTTVVAVVFWRFTPVPRGLMAWVAVTGSATAVLALLRLLWSVRAEYLWVGALAIALTVLTHAQGFAGRMAGIPLPPFPTVTGKVLFDDADDIAAEALAAAEHAGTPSVAELVEGAAAANTYLTALVASTSVFFVSGAVAVITPGHGRWWLQLVFVAALAALLVLRGRAFTDRTQAIVVVASGLLMLTAAAVKYALAEHNTVLSLAVAAGALALGLLMLAVAAIVPAHVFSPIFRKVVEWAEYALVVAVLPMALWLCNLYYLARNH
ncbi:type VII secretion integral membrane protein EccD [Mycobacterium sp. SP-6446]|uniref:type VII secretion integral membrane protein EccD n=1 Tax=Mycobacterium sp. SP-6446 TaxID=1834162 RepID=UPI00096D17C5|nr:type VII secretion integral membrane protein EccD [Mycobacterium sp. SP-6446]OMC13520.1 type VII secretion integral membrane protein EccD [Mycobacterium sp. SP-6446]